MTVIEQALLVKRSFHKKKINGAVNCLAATNNEEKNFTVFKLFYAIFQLQKEIVR